MKPIISVILTICDSSKFIDKCLDSILNQTLSPIEIIAICDNCDLEVLNKVKKYDHRVIVIDNKHKLGLATCRNKGLSIANGTYISFVNECDYVDPRMYEEMVKHFKDDVDIVQCSSFRFSRTSMNPIIRDSEVISCKYLTKCSSYVFDKLFKRSIIVDNGITFDKEEYEDDMDFISKYLYYSNKMNIISDPFYYSSLDSNSINVDSVFKELDSLILFYNQVGDFYIYEREIIKLCSSYYLKYISYSNKDYELCRDGVYRFLKYFKDNFKHYKLILNTYHTKIYRFYRSSFFWMKIYLYFLNLFTKR